ncbi:MAG: efflux RND transporter periplasmic adaptor subunit [Bryobacterales bacterium]|nr:efflux RND transporter periplasmic adaptor subunit [Bryobacterales bacterium]
MLKACQTGGAVIDWVIKTRGVSFRHAVELLRADQPSFAAGDGPVVAKDTTAKLEPQAGYKMLEADFFLSRSITSSGIRTMKTASVEKKLSNNASVLEYADTKVLSRSDTLEVGAGATMMRTEKEDRRRDTGVGMLALLGLLGLLPAWGQSVEVVNVTSKVLERKSRLPGEFAPYQTVDLHARVGGYVEKVEVDIGSTVKAGQLLVTLSAPEMKAQLAEAEAKIGVLESQKIEAEVKLLAVQSTYEKLKAASATPGVIAGNELVLAEKAVDVAKAMIVSLESSAKVARAAVDAQKELMAYLQVHAPFDGVITQRWAHPGALVGPAKGQALLRVEQQSRLRLIVAVPEGESGNIPRGAKVAFTVPAYIGETFAGTVARHPHTMDAKTRTMPVELDVVNTGLRLTPGMYPEVQWPYKRPRASTLVPPTAIVTTTERSFVIRVSDGKTEWVNVSRGLAAGDLVEVFGGVKDGDTVVKRGSDEIREGATVAVKR